MRRILFLARAEVLHVVRDRATLAQVLVVPVVQLVLLSNAATFQIVNTPTYVVDFDRTPASRGLVTRFAASGHFRVTGQSASLERGNDALLRGEVTMVMAIPREFEASLVRTRTAPVQLAINAEKGSAAGIVQAYALNIVAAYASELGATMHPSIEVVGAPGDEPLPRRGASRIDVRVRNWYNPTLNYRHYMVPGILVALVTLIGTLMTAQNIAREKELGTLEQLNVTPITRGQFIAAKLLPFWVLGLVTQQQAMFVTFFVMIVYLLMSGLFTPIDSMAPWVQTISQLNPVRHFVTISRAVLIKGAGLREVARPLVILAVYGAVMLTLAVRQYSKRSA
jgi:ABC-type multidrug transport system permease subunit